jgi:DNA-directed RNA polymerase specialized sigma24 family protein
MNRKVYMQLIAKQSDKIYNMFFQKFKNIELAEQLTQKCYLNLWMSAQNLPLDCANDSLLKIANNELKYNYGH